MESDSPRFVLQEDQDGLWFVFDELGSTKMVKDGDRTFLDDPVAARQPMSNARRLAATLNEMDRAANSAWETLQKLPSTKDGVRVTHVDEVFYPGSPAEPSASPPGGWGRGMWPVLSCIVNNGYDGHPVVEECYSSRAAYEATQ